jgi:small subunit ribosomal protein S4
MAPTIVAARQLVGHGHILVNQAKVDIPSYSCSVKDIISIKIKKLQEILNLLKNLQIIKFQTI